MEHIRTKDIQVGMTLSTDVSDKSGRLLLGKGCELTDKHILALKAWGVTSVDIEEGESALDTELTEIPEELMEKCRNEVAVRFKYSNTEHPFIKTVMDKAIMVMVSEQMHKGVS